MGLLGQIKGIKAADLTSGLAGYWKFEDAGGYQVKDSSGQGNSGYMGRKMLWGFLGKVGSALMFDGNKYITMGDLDDFDFGPNDNFTVSAWVNLDKNIKDYRAILGKASEASKDGYALRYDTNGSFGMMIESSQADREVNVVAKGDYRDDQWHLVTGVVNRADNTSSIYVDGLKKNSANISQVGSLLNNFHFNIGALANNSIFFQGFIDEVRIYNRALSDSDVIELYNQECGCSGVHKAEADSLLRAKNDYKVYYINKKGQKKWIINQLVFDLYNNKWENVVEVTAGDLSSYPAVDLMRAIGDYKVYYISGNAKKWIKTIQEFESAGYSWEDVDNVLPEELAQYLEK